MAARSTLSALKWLLLAPACLLSLQATAASFLAIDSSFGTPGVLAMSADGSTLVGASSGSSSFMWRADTGLQRILPLETRDYPLSQLWDVTPDGGIAVGLTDVPCCSYPVRVAATWTPASGWAPLASTPEIANPYRYSARAISDDGRIIVGHHQSCCGDRLTPVLWVDGVAQIPAGMPIGSSPGSISADGSVVVGNYAPLGSGRRDAFVWTEAGGFINLTGDTLACCDDATAISADGRVVVGYVWQDGGYHAFRWTSPEGLRLLAMPDGFSGGLASDVTGDGALIVGQAFTTAWSAALWDDEHGMRLLQDVLTNELGLDLTGWQLTGAGAVSRDGRYVAGQAIDPRGRHVAYVADLAPVPIPAVGWMLGPALAVLAVRRKSIRRPPRPGFLQGL
ncbi:MAG: hypothetical protein J0M16_03065 [Gammaproteobacteria bacterium]|nr:hypothetical protein [Gammaproteobacteria bacterium]